MKTFLTTQTQRLIPVLLMGLMFMACSSSSSNDEGNEPVVFTDVLLEAQVRQALDIGGNAAITRKDMLRLDTLNINAGNDFGGELRDIEVLTGLEYAENLVYLHMGQTSITDLTPIGGLRNISYLRLNNTAVTDLSPIAGITSLTYFNINTTTGITDISPLAGNAQLQELIMRNVPFGDAGMSTLLEFPVLYRLNMRDTGVTNISVLAQMMANGALQNSTPLAAENGGATLDLRGNTITNYEVIAQYVDNIANLDGYPSN
jgi:Leucine-rich repeat (LRR) protein